MGLCDNKFGIIFDCVVQVYCLVYSLFNFDVYGIDCYIGLQLIVFVLFIDVIDCLLVLIDLLKVEGIYICYLDVGGGLGVVYCDELFLQFLEYVKVLLDCLECYCDLELIFELGCVIVVNVGVLVIKVEFFKYIEYKNFVIIDVVMNDLICLVLY